MRSVDILGRERKQPLLSREPRVRKESSRARKDVSMRIEEGDCLEVIERLVDEGMEVDAVVTDPPYHMQATVKRFKATKVGGHTDVERRAQSGKDGLGRLAKGFMGQQWDGGDISFRPETWSTIATIMRPGAFLLAFGGTRTYHRIACAIEDSGLVIQDCIMWLYGSGFPKNSATLKPAFEPICLAYKPGGKRALRVDECLIGVEGGTTRLHNQGRYAGTGWRTGHEIISIKAGRWPANVCHDGSEEVVEAFPESAGGGFGKRGGKGHFGSYDTGTMETVGFGDGGSAARFFYTAKADKDERQGSGHPTVKPIDLMKWLVRLVTPYKGVVLDPFAGTGSTGAAAYLEGIDSIMIERDPTYAEDLRRKVDEFKRRRQRTLY